MRNHPNPEHTAEAMRNMAENMRESASKLDRLANDLEAKADWDTPSEALNVVANLIPNLRIDLLASRPIRQFQFRVGDLEDQIAKTEEAESQ